MSHAFVTTCPLCNETHEYVTSAKKGDDIMPDDGDLTLCWNCGGMLIFESGLDGGLRLPNPAEWRLIDTDPDIQQVRRAFDMELKRRGEQ